MQMMVDNVNKLKNASNSYILNDTYEITEKLLAYISERIKANKQEIEELGKIKKEKYTFEDIVNAVNSEIQEEIKYKNYRRMYINKENFISTRILVPVGIIAVEVYDTVETIKYFIKAIKSRNAIAISDVEYDEDSVKFLILEIIKEALRKFNIDENLIMILPYEECFYKYFDKVIYTYNEQGEELSQNNYEEKEQTNNKYIYIEDSKFEEQARKETEGKFLKGNIDEAIEKINSSYSEGAVIYTANPESAYKFINLVKSKNVMVNASLQNIQDTKKSSDEMYIYKNIILPIPQEARKEIEVEKGNNQEWALVKVNDGIFEKIKRWLKKLFNR